MARARSLVSMPKPTYRNERTRFPTLFLGRLRRETTETVLLTEFFRTAGWREGKIANEDQPYDVEDRVEIGLG